MRERLQEMWERLPPSARTPNQLAGVGGVGCGATHGIFEQCNYSCTSCYLSDLAQRTRPLPFVDVKAQLDQLRAELGPGGKVQITSGEVTLLPLSELGRIIAYARSLELDAMVMTNGERFLREPDYLPALVRDYNLQKVSFHVDTTQVGRPELEPGMSERDLHFVRDRYAELVRRVRRETGKPLQAAMTMTVTPDNAGGVGDVVRWGLVNVDAIRLLSFLPTAEVGRTLDAHLSHSSDELWCEIARACGKDLNADVMRFGHPACNVTVPLVVAAIGEERHCVELVPMESPRDARAFGEALRLLAPRLDLDAPSLPAHLVRATAVLTSRPRALASFLAFLARRTWASRSVVAELCRGLVTARRVRLYPLMLVIHRFMDEAELKTPLGRERLAACIFKVPVDGELVSMCQVNATPVRRELNRRQVRGAAAASG